MRDLDVRGLTADSRRVERGFLFVALPGSRANGADYIADAVRRGAVAVLAPKGAPPAATAAGVPVVADENPRRRLALMAARFYGAQPATIAAVTGTNGKTSVASFTRQIWTRLGYKAASLGTLGIDAPAYLRPLPLTTPDPVELHEHLAALAKLGIDHLAIEASSHGLDQYRLDGVGVAAAAFTNLTRDHLDYHRDVAAYRDAKLRLFGALMAPGGTAVLNADSPEYGAFAEVCRRRGHTVVAYGFGAGADHLRIERIEPLGDGLAMAFAARGQAYQTILPLAGRFQAMNALCALGLVFACGGDQEAAIAALAHLEGTPGRLQLVGRHLSGAPVYVDYAHTPDALETILEALRPHAAARLIVVFGCGGDRDPGKRPMMGEIAARLADRVVVTDDNPRSEEPAEIRRQILAACPGAEEAATRAEAIQAAVAGLEPGDLLIIAGKGHERGQIIGHRTLPFDDAEVARDAISRTVGEAR